MRATGFTHVSISARDLDESVRFYEDFFGMEEVPSPEFSSPVRWLRVGNLQLHLFLDESPAPDRHHFALDVDDFEAAYLKARKWGVQVASGNYSTVRELPGGEAQMYINDPAGNLVEINGRDAAALDPAVIGETRKVGGPADAVLYMPSEKEGIHRG
ncbi:hypothetical protein BH18ACT10_BH18ACT10_14870 [soil metagenome]